MRSLFHCLSLAIFIALLPLSHSTAQDTTTTSKHKFYIKAGIGALPANLGGQSPVAPYNRSNVEKSVCYHMSVQYTTGKNTALSLTGGFYKFSDQYDKYYPETGLPATFFQDLGTSYKYSVKTRYVALEGSLIYYRLHHTSISFYSTAGIALTHTTASTWVRGIYHMEPGFGMCGLGFLPQEVDENKLKGQLTPIGIRGGGKIGWYAEAGYGYKGILNAGVSLRL